MTPETRTLLKQAVHHKSRAIALAWIAAHGTVDCDECGKWIEQKPRRRFCSTACRTRHDDRTSLRPHRVVNRSYRKKVAA